MATYKSSSLDKKLTLIYRVESGLLGPDGLKHVEDFCLFAQSMLQQNIDLPLTCLIKPRIDKTLSEISFELNGKNLNDQHINRYFSVLGTSYCDFKDQFENDLEFLITQYLRR